jgi:sugar phosphate isomerase/epimerase
VNEETGDNGERGPIVLAAGSMLDHDSNTLIRTAAPAGFDGVGLRISGEHDVDSVEQATLLRRMAGDLGMRIHDTEVIRIDASWSNRLPDDAARLLEVTAALGARQILVVSDVDDVAHTEAAVHLLVRAATPLGVAVALEYMAWTTPQTPAAALDVANAANCKIVVDLLHHVRVGATANDIEAIVDADRLAWVQICDAADARVLDLGHFDRHAVVHEARHDRLPPGQGALPLDKLMAPVPGWAAVSVEVQSAKLAALEPDGRARRLYAATVPFVRR